MKAVRPIFMQPVNEPTHELNMGSGQDEYETLPVTSILRTDSQGNKYFVSVSRWKLTDDERASIYHGEADVVHQVIHTIGAYPPMNLQIVDTDQDAAIVGGI